MEKPLTKSLFCILTIAINVMMAQNNHTSPIVLVDPGHGGIDSGAISSKKQLEKDIVLKISKEMIRLNQLIFPEPLELYMTRYSDTLISLRDRGLLAKALGADLFVSVHGNHAPNPSAQGIEVFTWKPTSNSGYPFGIESISLANFIALEIKDNLGLKSRGLKQANFQVLRDKREQCPTILLEIGFLSNGEEADYLKSDRSITSLATAILLGITKHLDYGRVR